MADFPSVNWQQSRASPLRLTQERRSPEQQLLSDIEARSDRRAVGDQNAALGQIAALIAAVHPTGKALGAVPKITEMLMAGSRHPAAIAGGAGLGAMLSDNPGQGAIGGAMDMALGLPMATMLGTSDAQAGVLGDAAKKVGVPIYSALQRAFAQAPKQLENASGSQWAQWLEKNAGKLGVRKLEMETSQVIPYLQGMGPEKVSRGALEQYADQALPQIEKKVLGENTATIEAEIAAERDRLYDAGDPNWATVALRRGKDEKVTKFANYQLPGGSEYRETLLKLPQGESKADAVARRDAIWTRISERIDFPRDIHPIRQTKWAEENVPRLYNEWQDASRVANGKSATSDVGNFRSQHWDDPNVLAHYRSNQRTDTEGNPVNFIEELQSDWAQKGRKEGFATRGWDEIDQELSQLGRERTRLLEEAAALPDSPSVMGKFRVLNRDAHDISEKMRDLRREQDASLKAVPTAPFVTDTKDWTRLAVRNAIEDAVNQGHGNVAWTKGAQQADRYDLSKQVGKIYHSANGDGTYTVSVHSPEGAVVWEDFKAKPNKLEETIGKEVTQKIVAGDGGVEDGMNVLSGLDLQVGGEGMKGYYDKIVPQVVEEYLRNAGVPTKVGVVRFPDIPAQGSIGHGESIFKPMNPPVKQEQPGFRLTPEQITHIKEKGLPFFSMGAVPLVQEPEEFRKGGLAQCRKH